jgi:hypothetical protein
MNHSLIKYSQVRTYPHPGICVCVFGAEADSVHLLICDPAVYKMALGSTATY